MFQFWPLQLGKIFSQRKLFAPRRSSRLSHRRELNRSGALISQLEVLELRQMLTSLVAVNMAGGTLHLTDISSPREAAGDNFSITYTASQVVLTGDNGTSFRVGGQTQSSYTLDISSPISISMSLNRNANDVSLTGDGTATLANITVFLGAGNPTSTLSLSNVLANSVTIFGGGDNSNVTLSDSQINQNLVALLGFQSGDVLDLENTTVSGSMTDHVGQLTVNKSSISGNLVDLELGSNSTYNSTDSNYNNVLVITGRDGVINYLYSADGSNHVYGKSTYIGRPRYQANINLGTGSTTNDIPATVIYNNSARMIGTTATAVQAAPSSDLTVNSLAAATTTPTITGTYSSENSATLTVNVNGTTYTLGTDSQLTSPSDGQWSLDLTGAPLSTSTTTYTVTATTTDKFGNETTATGTVTNEQAIINTYVTAKGLTSSNVVTSSGLNYDITTTGTGSVPTSGETLSVNYTGYLLNSDGTQGTEFDSNTDPTSPFSFVLGEGHVIPGWDEAFALFPVGTSATLIIPSALGYGPSGSGTTIPPNSILIFTVTLLSASQTATPG